MIIKNLISYYEENVSDYGLVYKYIPYLRRLISLLGLAYVITAVLMIIGLIHKMISDNIYYWFFIPFIVVFVAIICVTKFQVSKITKILNNNYQIFPDPMEGWKNQEYKEKQHGLLVGYLKRNKLYEKQKIEYLIDRINELSLRKFPPLLAPSIVVAFILPLWNHLIPIIYKYIFLGSTLWKVVFMLLLVLSVFISIFFTGIINRLFHKFKDTVWSKIFRNENTKRKEINEILHDIYLSL
ncbi:hypothetical protein [Paenibacillus sp. FSL R5-0519]|uniref:hypothetical protein n=1 Tax=Paenibacillus sp. FSL R5-0519 TaxID=2921648 RepID=UPI0030D8DBF7